MGTQSSTPGNYLSSKSPSPTRTPSIEERSTKRCVADDSPMTTPEIKSQEKVTPFPTSYYDVKIASALMSGTARIFTKFNAPRSK